VKRFLTGVAGAAIWAATALAAQAAPLFEPGLEWSTLETPHFRIYYTKQFAEKAKQVAAIAEDAHAKLTPYMQVEPHGVTEVIIADGYDELNSMAHNSPHRAVWLWMTPPNPDEGMLIGRYDQWLRLLFTHEYTHILQFEQTPWYWNQVNTAAGGLLLAGVPQLPIEITLNLPDLLTNPPAFILEGHAVHSETRFTGGGRAVEGDFEMERRSAILSGREPKFDQIVGRFLLDWPVAGYEYTWGTAYIDYMTSHYGEDAPIRVFKAYGALPYRGWGNATESVIGLDPQHIYGRMMDELRVKYTKDEADWKLRQAANKFPALNEVTTTGRYHRHPQWKPDGTLLFGEALKNKGPRLMATKLDGEAPVVVFGKSTRSSIAYDAHKDRYYYESETSDSPKGLTGYRDIFWWDPTTKKSTRITHSARTFAPAISPDGTRLVAMTSGDARSGLGIFDTEGKLLHKWDFDNNDYQFGNPVWSPDSKQIVVATWHGGSRDIWLVDPETGVQKQLWADISVDFYPSWSPDGKYIVFTSDRTAGIFNLFAYNLQTHALSQLTDILGGAFDPVVSPDGKTMAFSNYTGRGYDIVTMPFQPETAPQVATLDPPTPTSPPVKVIVPPPPALQKGLYAYSPLPTLTPSVWFPVLGADEWGTNLSVYTFWQDVLRMHTLTLIGGYGFFSQRLNYGIRYENGTSLPVWSVGMNEYPFPGRVPLQAKTVAGDTRWADLWQWSKSASLSFEYPGLRNPMFDPPPITGVNWTWGLTTENIQDYALQVDADPGEPPNTPIKRSAITTHPPVPTARDSGQTHSAFLQWQRAEQIKYPYDYGPMTGQISTLGVEAGLNVPDTVNAPTAITPVKLPLLPTGTSPFTRLWADHRFYQEVPYWPEFHIWQDPNSPTKKPFFENVRKFPKNSIAIRGTAGLVYNQDGTFYYGIWRQPFGYEPLSTINRWDLTTATSYNHRQLLVRGYSFVLGNRDLTLGMEYRVPLAEVERGWGDFPVFLNRIYAVGFIDSGLIWGLDSTNLALGPDWATDFKLGAGGEIRAQTTMFQAVPIDVHAGLAHGFTAGGDAVQVNVGLGTTF
jgi:Tol biopolymer transport system component